MKKLKIMRKRKVKNYLKTGILFLTISLSFINCEKDENIIQIEQHEIQENSLISSSKYISSKEIPDIINLIQPESNIAYKSALVSTPLGDIDIENILQVIDTLGNNNYSFLILPETPKPNSIFNLVISTSSKKDTPNMAIMEYRMTDEFAQAYNNGTRYFSEFTGTIYKYRFNPSSFSNIFARESCVQNIDEIIICDEVPVSNGGTSTGGGGGTSDGSGYVDDGYNNGGTSSGGSITVSWVCAAGSNSTSPQQCADAPVSHGGTWVITIIPATHYYKSNGTSKKLENCCDDTYVDGSVGVNLTSQSVVTIINCLDPNNLPLSEITSLLSTSMARKTSGLGKYLADNNCSEDAKEFGTLAKDAILNGGTVDYVDQIITDPSVSNCLKNIIKLLQIKDNHFSVVPSINDQPISHISQAILDLFDNSKQYSLEFSVEQLGTSNGNEINGETTKLAPDFTSWGIKIDSDLASNGTQLFIAKTIIHESVHAIMGYSLKEFRTSDFAFDLQELYNTKGKNQNLTEHEFMSQYVEAFAYSLAAWDNHRQTMDYYKMLSWGGLETSSAYEKLNNKIEIQNAIQNERYNKNDAKGTKCN